MEINWALRSENLDGSQGPRVSTATKQPRNQATTQRRNHVLRRSPDGGISIWGREVKFGDGMVTDYRGKKRLLRRNRALNWGIKP